MRIIARRTLREFWKRKPDSERPLLARYREVRKENWRNPADIKKKFGSASILAGNRVVFNIKGNDYRIVARINCEYRIVYVRFVGTHAEYDAVNAKDV